MSKDAAIVFLSPLWVEAYGPGGSYNKFTGKDASRAVAKWSMAEEDLNDNLVRPAWRHTYLYLI